MKKVIRYTLVVIAILVFTGAVFFAGTLFVHASAFGMMGNYGWNRGDNQGSGPGMMGGSRPGIGMMGGQGGYGMGSGMMVGNGYNLANNTPLTFDEAKSSAESYLAKMNNSDLKISEIMIFDNNAYIVVTEASTGLGAFELLVDPTSRIAYPEHGPNIMWNLKYGSLNHQNMMGGQGGMMSSMMGGNGWSDTLPTEISPNMTVTSEKAIQYAQAYLDANQVGTTAATDPVQFYGYYTLDFERDGKVVGMLSVNGSSGQVFLHTWHGTFIEEKMY
jgi:hypothetical protein